MAQLLKSRLMQRQPLAVDYESVVALGHVALVEVAFHPHVAKVVDDLRSRRFANGLVLSAKSVEKTVSVGGRKPRRREVPISALRQRVESNAAALEQRGFFKALSSKAYKRPN